MTMTENRLTERAMLKNGKKRYKPRYGSGTGSCCPPMCRYGPRARTKKTKQLIAQKAASRLLLQTPYAARASGMKPANTILSDALLV
jgi:hypothetical protein